MKKVFQSLAALSALVPCVAAADADSYSAGYKLGFFVGQLVRTYGVYIAAAALLAVVAWLWLRSRKPHAIGTAGKGD